MLLTCLYLNFKMEYFNNYVYGVRVRVFEIPLIHYFFFFLGNVSFFPSPMEKFLRFLVDPLLKPEDTLRFCLVCRRSNTATESTSFRQWFTYNPSILWYYLLFSISPTCWGLLHLHLYSTSAQHPHVALAHRRTRADFLVPVKFKIFPYVSFAFLPPSIVW